MITTPPRRVSWAGLVLTVVLIDGCGIPQMYDVAPKLADRMPAEVAHWPFDGDPTGQVPKRWSIRQTNPTESLAAWSVIADATAPSGPNVMALTASKNYNGTFNLAIAENTSFTDLDLTVRAKAVSGKEDQGGGPVWRCTDENNYYICRFNPLESNYRVYKVEAGKRRQLDSAKIDLKANRWYTLRVTMRGDHVTCYLDGKKLLEATDATFPEAGQVGLWTKADAVTSFDELTVRAVDRG